MWQNTIVVKTTLYLEDETADAIRRIARSSGRSQSDVIREALARYAYDEPKARVRGIGAYRSGRGDVSVRAEEILREHARTANKVRR